MLATGAEKNRHGKGDACAEANYPGNFITGANPVAAG
jgi:hypothetical protein